MNAREQRAYEEYAREMEAHDASRRAARYDRRLEAQTAAALWWEERRREEHRRLLAVRHLVSRLALAVPQLDRPAAGSGYPRTVDEANERLAGGAPPEPRGRLQFADDGRGDRWCVEWPAERGTTDLKRWPRVTELGPAATLPDTPEAAEFLARCRRGRWHR